MQAFQTLKNKIYFLGVWRRVRTLWEDYKSTAGGADFAKTQNKFNAFLDSFKSNYSDLVTGGYLDEESLDRIYGDMGDILVEVIEKSFRDANEDQSKRLAKLIDKALEVAELILHDEKYRALVKQTPNMMSKLISLFETLQTTENKKTLLRLIATLGESAENQIEIGKLEGFRKILLLLLEQDPDLSSEIYSTLSHLLDVAKFAPPPGVTDGVEKIIAIAEGKEPSESQMSTKATRVFSGIGQAFFQITSKAKKETATDTEFDVDGFMSEFIPAREDIASAMFEFAERESFLHQDFRMRKAESNSPDALSESPSSHITMLQEFMRAQGTLNAITTGSVSTGSLEVQLEWLETICKLLYSSPKNQAEFRKINGYEFLFQLFESRGADFEGADGQEFLNTAFDLLYSLCLDGRRGKMIGNSDSFALLYRLVTTCRDHNVQCIAIETITDLLTVNPHNLVAVYKVEGTQSILNYISSATDEDPIPVAVLDQLVLLLQYTIVLGSKFGIESLTLLLQSVKALPPGCYARRHLLKILHPLISDLVIRGNLMLLKHDTIEICVSLLFLLSQYSATDHASTAPSAASIRSSPLTIRRASGKDKEKASDLQERRRSGTQAMGHTASEGPVRATESPHSAGTSPRRSRPEFLYPPLRLPSWTHSDSVHFAAEEIRDLLHCIRILFPRVPKIFQTIDPFSALLPLTPVLFSLQLTEAASAECVELLLHVICQLSLEEAQQAPLAPHLMWFLELLHDPSEFVRKPPILISLFHLTVDLMSHIHGYNRHFGTTALVENRTGPLNTKFLRMSVTGIVKYLTLPHPVPVRQGALWALGRLLRTVPSTHDVLMRHFPGPTLSSILIASEIIVSADAFDIVLEIVSTSHSPDVIDRAVSSRQKQTKVTVPVAEYLFVALLPARRAISVATGQPFASSNSPLVGGKRYPPLSASNQQKRTSSLRLPAVAGTSLRRAHSFDLSSTRDASTTSATLRRSPSLAVFPQDEHTVTTMDPPSLVVHSPLSDELMVSPSDQAKPEEVLSLIVFEATDAMRLRSPSLSLLLFDLLDVLSPSMRVSVATQVVQLCEKNDANTQMISLGIGISGLLRRLSRSHAHTIKSTSPEEEEFLELVLRLLVQVGRYNVNAQESLLLFDFVNRCNDLSLKTRVLTGLSEIATRVAPPCYFSFTGKSGHFRVGLVDRFPPSSAGSTLSFWMTLGSCTRSEQGLISWTDHQSGLPIFELYLKEFSSSTSDSPPHSGSLPSPMPSAMSLSSSQNFPQSPVSKYHLSIQTDPNTTMSGTFSLENSVFTSGDRKWHHVVITHKKQALTLYVNGLRQQSAQLADPRTLSSDRPLSAFVGKRVGKSLRTHFCGKLSTMYFLNGIWPSDSVSKAFAAGPLSDVLSPSELKPFLVLQPRHYAPSSTLSPSSRNMTPPPSPRKSSPSLPSLPPSPIKNSPQRSRLAHTNKGKHPSGITGSIQDKHSPAGVLAHNTSTLTSVYCMWDSMREREGEGFPTAAEEAVEVVDDGGSSIDGVSLSLSLLQPSSPHFLMVASLQYIASLVMVSPALQSLFFDGSRTHDYIEYVLMISWEKLTTPCFEVLLSLACATPSASIALEQAKALEVKHERPLMLILTLLIHISKEICQRLPAAPGKREDFSKLFETIREVTRSLRSLVSLSPSTNSMLFLSGNGDPNLRSTGKDTSPLFLLLQLVSYMSHLRIAWRQLERVFHVLIPQFTPPDMALFLSFLTGNNFAPFFAEGSDLKVETSSLTTNTNSSDDQSEATDTTTADSDSDQRTMAISRFERMRSQLLHILFQEMTKSPAVIALVRDCDVLEGGALENGGFNVVFSLLKSETEGIRVNALKILSVILHRNRVATTYFSKIFGFEIVALLLSPFPLTLDVGKAMFGVCLDEYVCTGLPPPTEDYTWKGWLFYRGSASAPATTKASDTSLSSRSKRSTADFSDGTESEGIEGGSKFIVHPEVLSTLFELLHHVTDERLKTALLVQVSERLLSVEENLNLVWDHKWVDWVVQFLHQSMNDGTSTSASEEDALTSLHSAETLDQVSICIRRLMYYELGSKSPRFSVVKEHPNEQFQGHIIEILVDFLRQYPRLPLEAAPTIISNLVSLFKHLKGLQILPHVFVKVLDTIAALTVHNSAQIRSMMHQSGLFALRSDLMAYILRMHLVDPEVPRDLVFFFDFKSLAAHDDFRSFNALHLLFRIFHESVEDTQYMERLFYVLREVVGVIEENKILLRDLFDDDHSFGVFYSVEKCTDFTRWYFGSRGKHVRDGVVGRLGKTLATSDKKFKTLSSKLRGEHSQRQKKARARSNQGQKWNVFAMVEQKRKHVEVAATSDVANLLQVSNEKQLKDLKRGKLVYERTLLTSAPIPSPLSPSSPLPLTPLPVTTPAPRPSPAPPVESPIDSSVESLADSSFSPMAPSLSTESSESALDPHILAPTLTQTQSLEEEEEEEGEEEEEQLTSRSASDSDAE